MIDVISDSTFEYHYRDSGGVNVGGFDWNLQFSWHAVPERERQRRNHSWDPVWLVDRSLDTCMAIINVLVHCCVPQLAGTIFKQTRIPTFMILNIHLI